MADRREIELDANDVVAAAQILSWIAMPHRPQDGVDLLCQWFWARRRHRGEPIPDLPFDLKKPSRLAPQLENFRQRVCSGFRAGQWFELKTLSGPNRPAMFSNFAATTRSLAARRAGVRGTAAANEIRDVWSRRKPVAHMAIAAANNIAAEHTARNVGGFDLEPTLFNPVWVGDAILEAESRASGAMATGAFDIARLYRFHRDTF